MFAGALGAALLTVPHLKGLIAEGAPGRVWPASGSFAIVEGAPSAIVDPTYARSARVLPSELSSLFDQSGGQGLLVFQGGVIQLSHFAEGFGPDVRFNSFSMVKSLIGALILKAVSEGMLESTSVPIGHFIQSIEDESLQKVTLQQLLDMKSGILFETHGTKAISGVDEKDLEATFANPFGPMAQLHYGGLHTLIPHLRAAQGSTNVFSYQNINTALLGRVLESIYERPLQDILSEKIWKPSGASAAHWRQYSAENRVSAYCCLYATAMDWVRVGQFLASNGGPNGEFLRADLWQQFLGQDLKPEQLLTGAYRNHTRYDILDREGENLSGRFTYFMGRGGQILYLMPEKDLVVIRFGRRHQLLHSTLYGVWRSMPKKLNHT